MLIRVIRELMWGIFADQNDEKPTAEDTKHVESKAISPSSSHEQNPEQAAKEARREQMQQLIQEFATYENPETAQKRLVSIVDLASFFTRDELSGMSQDVALFLRKASQKFVATLLGVRSHLKPVKEIVEMLHPDRFLSAQQPYGLELLDVMQNLADSDADRCQAINQGRCCDLISSVALHYRINSSLYWSNGSRAPTIKFCAGVAPAC